MRIIFPITTREDREVNLRMSFKCILCDEIKSDYIIVKHKTRNSEHKIIQCPCCGLKQLYPLPSFKEDKDYYDRNPHDKETTPDFSIEDIYEKWKYQNEYRIKYLEKDVHIRKGEKILDFGCGYGFLMEMLNAKGYDVEGVEISEDRLNVIKNRQGTLEKVKSFNLFDSDIPNECIERYGTILAFHVIEHITEPVRFLKKMGEMMKMGGDLLLEMPNIDNILMDISPEFNDYNYIRDHVAYYTPELIKKVVEQAGFEVVTQKGVQIYGLINNMNWVINGKPQLTAPNYEAMPELKWIEDYYKKTLEDNIRSEFMYILAKKRG